MTRVVATKGRKGKRQRGWKRQEGGRGGGGGREAEKEETGRRRRRRREREGGERSRGLAEEINNGLGNPRSVVHTGGKLPTIPDNGEKEERLSRRGW